MSKAEREAILAERTTWSIYRGGLNANVVRVHDVRDAAERYIAVLERALLDQLLCGDPS